MALTIEGKTTGTKIEAASEFDKHLTSSAAVGTVSVVKYHKDSAGVKDEKTIIDTSEKVHPGVVLQTEKRSMLKVSGGSTVNLGNFEFARIDVSLEMPTTKDDLEETFTFISEWVGSKIEQAVAQSKE